MEWKLVGLKNNTVLFWNAYGCSFLLSLFE